MVQSINSTQKIEETDGLPMPKRIWAVVSVGFALCMSVLDINIVNIVLPTLSHDFGTSPAVTTWIINGYQLAIVISLLSFSALGEIIGYRKVFLSYYSRHFFQWGSSSCHRSALALQCQGPSEQSYESYRPHLTRDRLS